MILNPSEVLQIIFEIHFQKNKNNVNVRKIINIKNQSTWNN